MVPAKRIQFFRYNLYGNFSLTVGVVRLARMLCRCHDGVLQGSRIADCYKKGDLQEFFAFGDSGPSVYASAAASERRESKTVNFETMIPG